MQRSQLHAKRMALLSSGGASSSRVTRRSSVSLFHRLPVDISAMITTQFLTLDGAVPLSLTSTSLRRHIIDDILSTAADVHIGDLTCEAISLLKWLRICRHLTITEQRDGFFTAKLYWMQQQLAQMILRNRATFRGIHLVQQDEQMCLVNGDVSLALTYCHHLNRLMIVPPSSTEEGEEEIGLYGNVLLPSWLKTSERIKSMTTTTTTSKNNTNKNKNNKDGDGNGSSGSTAGGGGAFASVDHLELVICGEIRGDTDYSFLFTGGVLPSLRSITSASDSFSLEALERLPVLYSHSLTSLDINMSETASFDESHERQHERDMLLSEVIVALPCLQRLIIAIGDMRDPVRIESTSLTYLHLSDLTTRQLPELIIPNVTTLKLEIDVAKEDDAGLSTEECRELFAKCGCVTHFISRDINFNEPIPWSLLGDNIVEVDLMEIGDDEAAATIGWQAWSSMLTEPSLSHLTKLHMRCHSSNRSGQLVFDTILGHWCNTIVDLHLSIDDDHEHVTAMKECKAKNDRLAEIEHVAKLRSQASRGDVHKYGVYTRWIGEPGDTDLVILDAASDTRRAPPSVASGSGNGGGGVWTNSVLKTLYVGHPQWLNNWSCPALESLHIAAVTSDYLRRRPMSAASMYQCLADGCKTSLRHLLMGIVNEECYNLCEMHQYDCKTPSLLPAVDDDVSDEKSPAVSYEPLAMPNLASLAIGGCYMTWIPFIASGPYLTQVRFVAPKWQHFNLWKQYATHLNMVTISSDASSSVAARNRQCGVHLDVVIADHTTTEPLSWFTSLDYANCTNLRSIRFPFFVDRDPEHANNPDFEVYHSIGMTFDDYIARSRGIEQLKTSLVQWHQRSAHDSSNSIGVSSSSLVREPIVVYEYRLDAAVKQMGLPPDDDGGGDNGDAVNNDDN